MSSLKSRRSAKVSTAGPAAPTAPVATAPAEVVIGRVQGVEASGSLLVDFPGNPAGRPVQAQVARAYDAAAIGRDVALMFLDGDPARPIAIGLVATPAIAGDNAPRVPERLVLAAEREIVLTCGHASILLTRDGKVLLRGTHMSLRSSGAQRITGATIQLN